MKTKRVAHLLVMLATAGFLDAQSFYMVSKQQQFLQTSATGATADPLGAFKFKSKAATNVTLTLPGGGTLPFVYDGEDRDFSLKQFFPTKAALDAAFPNGIYRMTGASIPALSFNLTPDNYPAVTPQVTSVSNGTWSSGGVLVIDPAQATTLSFSTFSGYTTSGIAGHMNFYLTSMTESGTTLETDVFSQPIFGQAATPAPLTSYTIPAGRLVSGRVYRAWLDFDTVATIDTAAIAGSAVGTLFSKEVTFYVGAQSPGTSTPAPVITVGPVSRTASAGGSVTFSAEVTVGGTPFSFQNNDHLPLSYTWTRNGQSLGDMSGSGGKYTNNTTGIGLTINSLTAADAGDYVVTVCTAGGVVMSSPATLTLGAIGSAPAITMQPQSLTVGAGSNITLSVGATGTAPLTYQWRKNGNAISGATNATFSFGNAQPPDSGAYTVLVSNTAGTATSNSATVTVTSGGGGAPAPALVLFNKSRLYSQTGAATVADRPGTPWMFGVEVEGENLTGMVAPFLIAPAGSSTSGVTLAYDGRRWSYRAFFANRNALEAAFAPGTYTLNAQGTTVALSLANDAYPNTPIAMVSAGTWTAGQLVVEPGQPLTISTNIFAGYRQSIEAHLRLTVEGQDDLFPTVNLEAYRSQEPTRDSLSTTIPGSALRAGGTYLVKLGFHGPADMKNTLGQDFAYWGAETTFEIVARTAGGTTPPTIATQPRDVTVNSGSTVALTATAAGPSAATFQWRKDGAVIPGATSDTLVLPGITAANAGVYTVVITTSGGSTTSAAAVVAITSNQPSRLPNLSVRTTLGTAQSLIVGFATNGAKTMLVRAVGPTLAAFGLTGTLPDPVIELYNSSSVKIDENNDWSPALASMFVDVGAFALNNGSRDAAVQRLCSGPHTAQIKSTGSGVVLVEVYDAAGAGKLVNVSARNAVGTGANILIAGFVVDGTAAKTLLIRGIGAKLAEFGVGGVLADPKLEIYNASGTKIAENDSWNALLQPIARSVGAFDLTVGSRDSALVLTLPPGAYTAQISGMGGTTGEALVEVYEVP